MFISREQVTLITGYEVDAALLGQAQNIIEVYVGRTEAQVDDAGDLAQLARATAYQAAYMKDDKMRVFEQAAVTQVGQFGQLVSFRPDGASPFVSPLAVMACKNLTWRRPRSIRTGSWFGYGAVDGRWETT